jgi:hypothetical protein
MQTFRAEVHNGYVFGVDDVANPNFVGFHPSIANCALKTLNTPTCITPSTSTKSSSGELMYYDMVAASIADLPEFSDNNNNKNNEESIDDNFRAIVLLTDVHRDGGTRRDLHQLLDVSTNLPWKGQVMNVMMSGGERYFLPTSQSIDLYHRDAEYNQLYAGRVVGVIGRIVVRDRNTNATKGVEIKRVIPAPIEHPVLHPQGDLLLTNTEDSADLRLGFQRLHFVPIPPHLEGDSNLDHFLRDTISFLICNRFSSMIIFVGPIFGNTADPGVAPRSNMAAAQKAVIADAAKVAMEMHRQQQLRAGSSNFNATNPTPTPIMYVPGVDDKTLKPSVIPQSNLARESIANDGDATLAQLVVPLDAETGTECSNHVCIANDPNRNLSRGFVFLPHNPAVFYTNGKNAASNDVPISHERNALTVVATSVDVQSCLSYHSVSRKLGDNRPTGATRIDTASDALLRCGLCVPYVLQSDVEDYAIEPSSLPELTVTPHIHFSPTSVYSQAQARLQQNGTLFVSCNVGPVNFSVGGRCPCMEVDVAPNKTATSSSTGTTRTILSRENVRVKCIDFIRYEQVQ